MKDLIAELQAASRGVATATLPAGAAKTVTIDREYPAEVDDVWDALTNPERIPRWFLPITGDLRVGGTYQLEGNAGGEIRACEPPTRLQVTWIFGEAPGPEDSSLVEVTLRPSGGGTLLHLEHTAVVPPEMWDRFGPGAVGVGWDLALLGLAAHLAGITMGSPEELDRDPAMREAMTASSESWGRALAASDLGVDADTVARLVAATTAFYVPPADSETGGAAAD
ncbi:MAG TPA: SRPBCC family protein [Acidimicrobiales bacterium]|nr:SRPBCC family protein [Acidimicrobiales bacterium]